MRDAELRELVKRRPISRNFLVVGLQVERSHVRVCKLRECNARFLCLNNSRGPAIRVKVFSGSIFGGGHRLEEISARPLKFLRILSDLAAR